MSDRDPTPSTRVPLLAALAVALVGLWPHAYAVPLHPESRDAVMWITRSAVDGPKGLGWVFLEPHFKVGYRPVTGLSFTVMDLFAGLAPAPQRVLDLGLHFGAALAIFALVRVLVPRLTPWAAVAAVALFVAHPVTQEVVPHLARRSYALATVLSVTGLWAMLRWPSRPVIGLGALALGALANETAYVALPVAVLLLWPRADARGRRIVAGSMAAVIAVLLGVRVAVLGGLGGYDPEADALARLPDVLASTLSGLLWLPVSWPAALAAVGLVIGGGVWTVWAARTDGDAEVAPIVLAVGAWLGGIVCVYLPQGVWFPRQIYPLVAPLACGFGLAVGVAASSSRAVHRALAVGTRSCRVGVPGGGPAGARCRSDQARGVAAAGRRDRRSRCVSPAPCSARTASRR